MDLLDVIVACQLIGAFSILFHILASWVERRRAIRYARAAGLEIGEDESTASILRRVGRHWTVEGPWR